MMPWASVGTPVVAVRRAAGERAFGLTVGGVLLALAALTAWRGHGMRAEVIGVAGAVLVATAVIRAAVLRPLAAAWGRLGHALGWFNSRVLLTLMFALVFVPIGWANRLFGSDPLDRRRRAGSRWMAYPERFRDPKHLERLF